MIRNRRRPRAAFSLIEVMVAMTVLGVIMLSLARLSVIVSVRGRGNDVQSKRNAVLQMEANKFGAMPYATLAAFSTTSQSRTAGDFTYTRRLSITNPSFNRLVVKIVVVPARDTLSKDSVTFDRIRAGTNALCSGC
jgi:prepilin-type N-terminal cleavage/methylation domain-containing protein